MYGAHQLIIDHRWRGTTDPDILKQFANKNGDLINVLRDQNSQYYSEDKSYSIFGKNKH
jgi:hypothetical protein